MWHDISGDYDPEKNLSEPLLGEAGQNGHYTRLKATAFTTARSLGIFAKRKELPDGLAEDRLRDIPDGHLLLGVKRKTVRKFADDIGFPKHYCRQAVFGALGEADWISRAYGSQLTGYDFAVAIRHWLKQNGKEDLSVAEVLIEKGELGVGMATCFVSHVQSQHIEDTLQSLECNPGLFKDVGSKKALEGEYLWLDYIILRQCQSDFCPNQIQTVVEHIRYTLAVEDDEKTYLTRSFCLMEVAATPPSCLWIIPSTSTRDEVRKGRQAAVRKYGKQFVLSVLLTVMAFLLLCHRAYHDAASLLHGIVGWSVVVIAMCCFSPLIGIGGVIIPFIVASLSLLYDSSYIIGMLFLLCIPLAAIAPFIAVLVNLSVSVTSFFCGDGCHIVVDAAAASSRNLDDKRKIDDFMRDRGGFEKINGVVERAYKHALGVGAASVEKAFLYCVDELTYIVCWPVQRIRLVLRRCVSHCYARRM